ncbi:MAG TPA: histidine kinase [Pilimelia sp.]|nr:histidine kinase [Pilimelia sp.]
MPRVDPYKLAHWMNARKLTPDQVCAVGGLEPAELQATLAATQARPTSGAALQALASALGVADSQLTADDDAGLTVVTQTAEAMYQSVRPITRDGIHFYNYYSMAAPRSRVAPVILDILCPADRLPALNNGHLEPAITVNLGPGDIHGRWGSELSPATWQVLAANRADDGWITGDSYVEPSYCPHSYSLAGSTPARIVSYTAQSNLAALIEETNRWSQLAFDQWTEDLDKEGSSAANLLRIVLRRRGYTIASAAQAVGRTEGELLAAVTDEVDAVGLQTLRHVARTLGIDYRILLPGERNHDPVGKVSATVAQSRASRRPHGGHEVASMAGSPSLPDLSGLFVRVDSAERDELHLIHENETHYLVVQGDLRLDWLDERGEESTTQLRVDGSAWVAPFVAHQWRGRGSLLQFNSGRHVGYLDLMELSNTYDATATLRRGHRDRADWGYER